MTKARVSVVGLLLLPLLAACNSTPVALKDATPVGGDRLFAFQNAAIPNQSILVVTRDVGAVGSACYASLMINGTLAARLDGAETARFYVPAGETLLRVSLAGSGLCGFNADYWTERETTTRPNETKVFRISTDTTGKVDIERAD